MIARARLSSWSALQELGFASEKPTGHVLVFDFGNLTLSAVECMNMQLAQVVLVGGVYSTAHSVAEVEIQLPITIASVEQCGAWLTWHLDRAVSGGFRPTRQVAWLQEGRDNAMLLPWIAERAAYAARPSCRVDRDSARPMLKRLGVALCTLPDDALVRLTFDGEVLKVRWEGGVEAVTARGDAWCDGYTVLARDLRSLPTRLSDPVWLGVWRGSFTLHNRLYPLHAAEPAG